MCPSVMEFGLVILTIAKKCFEITILFDINAKQAGLVTIFYRIETSMYILKNVKNQIETNGINMKTFWSEVKNS